MSMLLMPRSTLAMLAMLLIVLLTLARCQDAVAETAESESTLIASEYSADTRSSPPSVYEKLLGQSLYVWGSELNPDGTKTEENVYEMNTSELLKDVTVVGLYFSASWCGPCRQFTPQLVEFYKSMRKKGEKFEIVLVSGDQSGEDFLAYYKKMPWLAVTMDNLQTVTQNLSPKYQVRGIPHLVILDGQDASVYSLDGRNMVMNDKYGLEFPWRPRSIANLLPRSLRNLLKSKIAAMKSSLQERMMHILKGILPPSLWKLIPL